MFSLLSMGHAAVTAHRGPGLADGILCSPSDPAQPSGPPASCPRGSRAARGHHQVSGHQAGASLPLAPERSAHVHPRLRAGRTRRSSPHSRDMLAPQLRLLPRVLSVPPN